MSNLVLHNQTLTEDGEWFCEYCQITQSTKEELKKSCDKRTESYNKIIKKESEEKLSNFKMLHYGADYLELAKAFYETQPYFYDKSKLWWFWNKKEKRWEIYDETDILNSIDPEKKNMKTVRNKSRNEILESLKQIGRFRKPAEMKKTQIQFKNKVIDFISGEETQPTHEYFYCNPIPWEIADDDACPECDKIMIEWVGEEWKTTLYEIIGFCLISDYPIHRAIILYGRGRNGKGKFMELLTKLIGKDNTTSTDVQLLIESRFETAKL